VRSGVVEYIIGYPSVGFLIGCLLNVDRETLLLGFVWFGFGVFAFFFFSFFLFFFLACVCEKLITAFGDGSNCDG